MRCRCSPSPALWRADGDAISVTEYRSLGGVHGLDRGGGRERFEGRRRRPGDPQGPSCTVGATSPRAHSVAGRHRSRHRRAAPTCRPTVGNPPEARPLIRYLVEQRLLATDVNKDTGEATIEPAHEALLRQWGLLQGWLTEDAGLLAVLEGIKRASRDWAGNNRDRAWLAHASDRLAAAERLSARPDLAANLEHTDREYIAACRRAEANARRGKRLLLAGIYVLLVGIIAGLVGWINQSYIGEQWRWYTVTRPFMVSQVRPNVLDVTTEQALKAKDEFRECAIDKGGTIAR